MFLKNYTSGVPVSRTVARIEELLVEFGAKDIGKKYVLNELSAMIFQMSINGRDVLIRLPANPKAVYDALVKQVKRPREGTLEKLRDQAARTAWKVQQDWLEVELTKLALNQTEALQTFMPYVWDGERTYYDALKERGFRALLPEKCE